MKIETYQDDTGNSTVKNVAYCDIHTPADSDVTPLISRVNEESDAVRYLFYLCLYLFCCCFYKFSYPY